MPCAKCGRPGAGLLYSARFEASLHPECWEELMVLDRVEPLGPLRLRRLIQRTPVQRIPIQRTPVQRVPIQRTPVRPED